MMPPLGDRSPSLRRHEGFLSVTSSYTQPYLTSRVIKELSTIGSDDAAGVALTERR